MSEGHYSLQFSGLDSDSPEKLQRFKSICIADLDLSVEDTQGLLATKETRILRTSSSLPELQAFCDLLTAAGARMAILTPDGSTANDENGSGGLTLDLGEILDLDIPFNVVPAKQAIPRAPKEYHLDLDADLSDSLMTDSSLLFFSPPSAAFPMSSHLPDDTIPTKKSVDPASALAMSFVDDAQVTIGMTDSAGEDPLASLITSVQDEQSLHCFDTVDLVLGPTPEELSQRDFTTELDDALSLDLPMMGLRPKESTLPRSAVVADGAGTQTGTVAALPPASPTLVKPVTPKGTPEEQSPLQFLTSEDAPAPAQPSLSVVAPLPAPPAASSLQSAGLEFDEPTPAKETPQAQPQGEQKSDPPKPETPAAVLSVVPTKPVLPLESPQESTPLPITTPITPALSTLETATEKATVPKESHATTTEASALSRPQFIGLFLAGLILLLAGNWLLAPDTEETPVPEISALSTGEPALGTSAQIPKAPPAAASTLKPELKGEFASAQFSLSVTVLRDTAVRNAPTITTRFVLTTPKPPELTLEEIGQGALPHIWLKRVESDAVVLRASGENEWSGSVPTYTFVERGVERRRLPALTLVSLSVNDEGTMGEAKIDISYSPPGDTALPAQGALIEATEKKGYRLAVAATVPLKAPSN
jgi:hypothetical protein